MFEQYSVYRLSWATCFLVMACSGSYVKDVGDIDGPSGSGGGGPAGTAGTGGSPVASAGQGGETVVAQAGQGGSGETFPERPPCVGCIVDDLGPAETTPFAAKRTTVSANVVDVTSTRVLEEIEATLLIEKRTSAAWLVYEELDDQYALRLDLPTKLEPGDGVYRSDRFAVVLEAGHRYAIGIYLNAGACYASDAPETDQLSFGTVEGASLNGGGDYRDVSEIHPIYGMQFAMRLYTSTADMDVFSCPTDPSGLQSLEGQPCSQEGQQCLDPSPNCEHNYSVECTDGSWASLTGLSAPCP